MSSIHVLKVIVLIITMMKYGKSFIDLADGQQQTTIISDKDNVKLEMAIKFSFFQII